MGVHPEACADLERAAVPGGREAPEERRDEEARGLPLDGDDGLEGARPGAEGRQRGFRGRANEPPLSYCRRPTLK